MFYHFDILSHSLLFLFLASPGYGFLLGTINLVDSHLLVPVQSLPLIFYLLFLFFLYFLFGFVFLLRNFVSFLVILYYPLLFLCIPLPSLHQILRYLFLLAIYLFLFYFFDFCLSLFVLSLSLSSLL